MKTDCLKSHLLARPPVLPKLNALWLSLAAFVALSSLVRADGTLDPAFDPGTGCNGQVNAVVALPNSQILIGGSFTTYNGATANNIARLNVDGSLDTTFSVGTGLAADGSPVNIFLALQSNGQIIVGGSFTAVNGYAAPNLIRLNADGSPDPTFTPPVDTGEISALALDNEGRLYIANDQIEGTYQGSAGVARLNPDGSLDTTFEYSLVSSDLDGITAIIPQADGTVFIGGQIGNAPNTGVALLNANGTVDSAFAANDELENGSAAIAVQTNGQVLVAYSQEQSPVANRDEGNVIRLNADGSLDTSFNAGGVPTGPFIGIYAMILQPDGKILLGGGTEYSEYPGVNRLNTDGSLDASFDPGTGASDTVYALAVDPSGKILAGGAFADFDNVPSAAIARLVNGVVTPTVSVAVGVAQANEGSKSPATFILTLSAAQTSPVVVYYEVKGTAKPGVNYRKLTGQTTIQAGQTSRTIKVTPINKGVKSGAKLMVKLIIESGSDYIVGNPHMAKVKIVENH